MYDVELRRLGVVVRGEAERGLKITEAGQSAQTTTSFL